MRPSSRSSSTARARALRRWRAGSRRTPTRPRPGRSARPRSGRDARRCSGSLRSVWVELLREKHATRTSGSRSRGAARSSRGATAGSPRAQRSSAAPAARRCRPRPGAPACATSPGASPDLRRYARSAARSQTPAGHRARSSSSGYFFGRAIDAEHLLSPGHHPGFEVSVKPGMAHGRAIESEDLLSPRTSSWPQGLRRTRTAQSSRVIRANLDLASDTTHPQRSCNDH